MAATLDSTEPSPSVIRRASSWLMPERLGGVVLLVALATVYVSTLDNGLRPGELEGGDLITHQYAQVQARFSNAPGYPLFTMGGWVWFRVGRLLLGPASNPIPILSSYSTMWALLAIALLYALLLRVTRHNWPVALLTTAFFGLTYFFWYYAVTTEQYSSSVAWTLAVVLIAFRWQEARRDAFLFSLAVLMGVGLAHQITLLAIVAPLIWFVLREEPHVLRRPKLFLALLCCGLAPLLSYGYVYIRGAQHPEWWGAGQWSSTLDWFLSFLSTGQGRGELTWSLNPFFTHEYPSLIWGEMTWPGLVAGLAGLALLGRRRGALLFGTIGIYLVFCWIDRLGNWYQVIMPVYALLALGLGVSADRIIRKMSLNAAGWITVLAVLAGLGIYRGVTSYPRADSRDRPADTALQAGWAILADDPPPATPIFATESEARSLDYLTQIWGVRRDLSSVNADQTRALLAHTSVAVTEGALPLVAAEVDPDARFSAIGSTLSWVSAVPNTTVPAGLRLSGQDFGTEVRLNGGTVRYDQATQEQVVVLSWLALRRPQYDWAVSVRLLRGDAELAQADNAHPVHGAYPMSRWLPGEVVNDAYAFPVTDGAAPDAVLVILYRQQPDGGFTNLGTARFEMGG